MPELFYTKHAIQRMFERSISEDDVEKVISEWKVVKEYPDDNPYPSVLLMADINGKPLHVVCSVDKSDSGNVKYIVITVYQPSSSEWNDDFITRKVNK